MIIISNDNNGIIKKLPKVNYYKLFEKQEDGRLKVKYSQPIQPYNYLFSFSLIDEKVEEVVTRVVVEDGVGSRIAPWDKDKIYLQATDPFRASAMFKQFIDNHLKFVENEKEQTIQK